MLSPDEQTQFLAAIGAVRQHALCALGDAGSAERAVIFVGTVHRHADAIVAASEATEAPVQCQPGCAACCSARVEVSQPEAAYIAGYLGQVPDPLSAALVERLHAQASQPTRRDVSRQASTAPPSQPCAFLTEGLCAIYPVRPAVCRKAHSLSASACEAGEATIPQNLSRVLRCEALMAGTQQAFEHLGLPAARGELSQAVMAALSAG